MSTVYTALLFELDAAGGTSAVFGPVPTGHRYVATDIRMWVNGDQYQGLDNDVNLQFSGLSHNYRVLWVGAGFPYFTREIIWTGRQVLDEGNYATLVNQSRLEATVRVTGFDLVLP